MSARMILMKLVFVMLILGSLSAPVDARNVVFYSPRVENFAFGTPMSGACLPALVEAGFLSPDFETDGSKAIVSFEGVRFCVRYNAKHGYVADPKLSNSTCTWQAKWGVRPGRLC